MNPIKKNHDAMLRTGAMALAAAGASTAAHAATVQITFNNSFVSSTSGTATLDTDFGGDLTSEILGAMYVPRYTFQQHRVSLVAAGRPGILASADGAVIATAGAYVQGYSRVHTPWHRAGGAAIAHGLVAFTLGDTGVRGGAPTLGWLDLTATGHTNGEHARVDVLRFIFDDASGGAPVGVAHADAAYPEYVPAAVPEPSGLGLLALGAGGLLARRRRAMAA